MIEMIPILVYTHSSYIDVLSICIKQIQKYVDKSIKVYVGINSDYTEPIVSDERITILHYTVNQSYSSKIIQLMDQIEEEYILIVHEDMIPSNSISSKILELCESNMKTHNLWHVRSYMAFGNSVNPNNPICSIIKTNTYHYKLIYVPYEADYKMSIQPAIWKKSFYHMLLSNFSNKEYHKIEDDDVQSYITNYLDKMAYMHYTIIESDTEIDEQDLYYSHLSVNSLLYPHMNVCGNSRWAISENPMLMDLLKQYEVDINIRGYV